jgi:hypothetical protein
MLTKIVVAGTVALAGLALMLPVEAAGRGGGGFAGMRGAAVRVSPARAIAPRQVPRAIVSHPIHHVIAPVKRAHLLAHHRLRHFAFRNRQGQWFWAGDQLATDGNWPTGFMPGPADYPVNYPATEDVTTEDLPGARHPGVPIVNVPACREQEYVVPDRSGEDHTVRVLRC